MKAGDDQELGRGKQSEKELWDLLGMEGPQQAVSEGRVEHGGQLAQAEEGSWRQEAEPYRPGHLLPKPPPIPAGPPFHSQSSGQTLAEKMLGPLWGRAQPVSWAPAGALNQPCDRPPPASGAHEEEPPEWPLQTTPHKHKEPTGAPQGPWSQTPCPPSAPSPSTPPLPKPCPLGSRGPLPGFPPSPHIPPEPLGVCCLCPPLSAWGLRLQSWASSERCLFKA